MQSDISAQQTVPLPATNNAFHAYLREHKLLWVEVARAAGVPCLTVWSIDHDLVVDPLQAMRVRQGLYTLTSIPYTGPIQTMSIHHPSHNPTVKTGY